MKKTSFKCRLLIAAGAGAVLAGFVNPMVWLLGEQTRRLVAADRIHDDVAAVPRQRFAVVLGTSIHGELLKSRVEAAAELYRSGKVEKLLLSGDGRCASYHEPKAMRRMLGKLGVPDDAMEEDPKGLSTFESMKNAREWTRGQPFVIVTQHSHAPRAILLARGIGMTASALAAPDGNSTARLRERERFATIKALLDLCQHHVCHAFVPWKIPHPSAEFQSHIRLERRRG